MPKKTNINIILLIITFLFLGMLSDVRSTQKNDTYNNMLSSSQKLKHITPKPQISAIQEIVEVQAQEELKRIDEIGVFVNDENKQELIEKTKKYISTYQKVESPLNAEMIVNIAQKEKYSLDLILIQAHTESHFCTQGRAIDTKNCWNVGNVDAGDNKKTDCQDGTSICLDDYQKGLELYIHYMKSCHFHEKETISLQKFIDRDFRIVRQGDKICGEVGARYATDKSYRSKIVNILQNNFNPIFT